MEMSELLAPAVVRPTLERYEYFLATEEDMVVRLVVADALSHLSNSNPSLLVFLSRPGTTHTQFLFLGWRE